MFSSHISDTLTLHANNNLSAPIKSIEVAKNTYEKCVINSNIQLPDAFAESALWNHDSNKLKG